MVSEKISVLVIDHEEKSKQQLSKLLKSNGRVSEFAIVETPNEAILKIINTSPELILINYPVQGPAEEELFGLIKTKLPEAVIAFMASSEDYAKNAIRHGVYNYLMNPISSRTINAMINTTVEKKQTTAKARLEKIISHSADLKMKILTLNGYMIISPEELIYCYSANSCTEMYLTEDRKEISPMAMTKMEEKLEANDFARVTRNHIINPRYIKRYYKKTNVLTLSVDGTEYEFVVTKVYLKNVSKYILD